MSCDVCAAKQPDGNRMGGDRFPIELMLWLSPSFPVGAFAFSHALEWAVAAGRITDRNSAVAWIDDLLYLGGPAADAILLAAAWRCTRRVEAVALLETNELALALASSRERHLETTAQGNAFIKTMFAAWDDAQLAHWRSLLVGDVAYPVAVGVASAAKGIDLHPALRAFGAAWVANMASTLVRLSVIGQTDGQRVIAALLPAIERASVRAEHSTLNDIGGAAFLSDIGSMAHETQETRLFRT